MMKITTLLLKNYENGENNMVKDCLFASKEEKKKKIRSFLTKYGDNLPEPALLKAEALADRFVLKCDDNDDIISGVTFEKNDWYLCSPRYLATKQSERRKGWGEKVYQELFEQMKKDDDCYVITVDVTTDNIASIRLNEKIGMRKVNQFLWNPNDPSSQIDIMQFVKFIPRQEKK